MSIKLSDEISLWARRLALYFGLYVIVICSYLLISRLNIWHPNVDNANDLLGNLIQMEAAIIAIVISLSIVAVELAASSYSTRLVDVFIDYKKNPDFWILLSIYGITIFYGLGVQLNSPSNLKAHISLAYYLGIFAFVVLIPYIQNTIKLLKPTSVFDMLAENITKQNILDAISYGEGKTDKEDSLQPIVDIVNGSIMKYDYETAKYGLRAIGRGANEIFKNDNLSEENEISEHIINHLVSIGQLAISKDNEYSTREVISVLTTIGIIAVEHGHNYTVENTVTSLLQIGKSVAKKKLESSTVNICSSFVKIGIKTIEKCLVIIPYSGGWLEISYLKDIGLISAKCGLERVIRVAASSIVVLGSAAVEHRLKYTTQMAISSLEDIGIETGKCGLKLATQEAVDSLRGMIEVTIGKEEFSEENQMAVKSHLKIIKIHEELG